MSSRQIRSLNLMDPLNTCVAHNFWPKNWIHVVSLPALHSGSRPSRQSGAIWRTADAIKLISTGYGSRFRAIQVCPTCSCPQNLSAQKGYSKEIQPSPWIPIHAHIIMFHWIIWCGFWCKMSCKLQASHPNCPVLQCAPGQVPATSSSSPRIWADLGPISPTEFDRWFLDVFVMLRFEMLSCYFRFTHGPITQKAALSNWYPIWPWHWQSSSDSQSKYVFRCVKIKYTWIWVIPWGLNVLCWLWVPPHLWAPTALHPPHLASARRPVAGAAPGSPLSDEARWIMGLAWAMYGNVENSPINLPIP